jgi:hypothetical protein
MRINEKMNLVIPVYGGGEGEEILGYVHSLPLLQLSFLSRFPTCALNLRVSR